MSLEEMKKTFLQICEKGNKEGLDIEDYLKLRDMRNKLGISMEDDVFRRDYLNNEFFYSIEEMYEKGMRGILSYDDYVVFKKNMNKLDPKIVSFFSSAADVKTKQDLFGNLNDIIQQIYNKGLLHRFSSNDCQYILRNSFLLPLVLANNTHSEIKLTGDNRYMFLCNLHMEYTPSLGVSDLRNLMLCYGCGFSGSSISYLKRREGLSFPDAIQLLAQIYLFDVKRENSKLKPLVEKYQTAILSDEYQSLLEMGRDRLRNRHIEKFNGENVEELYNARYTMIDRIRRNEFDSNFNYEGPKKLVYLNEKIIFK